jgi:hypothetical protein
MAVNEVFSAARLPPPVATVEAWSTKIIHLTISANSRMLGIVPSDARHDIERPGGVRRLQFQCRSACRPSAWSGQRGIVISRSFGISGATFEIAAQTTRGGMNRLSGGQSAALSARMRTVFHIQRARPILLHCA